MIPATSASTFLAACGLHYLHNGATTDAIRTYVDLFKTFGKEKAAADAEAATLEDRGWCTTATLTKVRNEPVLMARADLFPGMLVTCIPQLTVTDDQAVDLAKEFLQKFRGHHFTTDLLSAITKRLKATVHEHPDSTPFGPAVVDRTVGGDKAVIIVHNNAPYPLWIGFSGPEPAFEDLDICQTCTVTPDENSKTCDEDSPPRASYCRPASTTSQ